MVLAIGKFVLNPFCWVDSVGYSQSKPTWILNPRQTSFRYAYPYYLYSFRQACLASRITPRTLDTTSAAD